MIFERLPVLGAYARPPKYRSSTPEKRLSGVGPEGLGDLYRSLILLGACGSYLTLRSPKAPQLTQDNRFSSVLERYLGGRAYAPRTGRRSKIMTAYLPIGVARSLVLYSELTSKLPSHVYTRFLRAGLLIYITCERRLAEALGASGRRVSANTNSDRR